ncbi:hypothetical protein SPI_03812 [Niveomyces insectorum RCEF 264]|uniref:Uncharacterized protein n=1 Tax=Niveomyces insectorum RCEF 264 TaxID=1081102 RepID=A0A167WDL0_9HYPO|nr:hypothetical protein SPI_03812 [Niveomyces insectorum RCEF 264]
MYECPQVFCFDHKYLLLLQFRANTIGDIRGDGEVDCWVLPRINPNGTPFRYALYRLLVQGWRRFQGLNRYNTTMGRVAAESVSLFSGTPYWRANNGLTDRPYNYSRVVDSDTGAFYWVDENGNAVQDVTGKVLWDMAAMW